MSTEKKDNCSVKVLISGDGSKMKELIRQAISGEVEVEVVEAEINKVNIKAEDLKGWV